MHLPYSTIYFQVFARETIVREITDQSDVYVSLERRLGEFMATLANVSRLYGDLEHKYISLEDRVNKYGKCWREHKMWYD